MVHRARLLIRRFEDAPQARPFAGLSLFGLPAMVDSTLDRTTIDVEKAAKLCVKKGPLRLAAHEGRPDRPYTGEEDYSVALEQGCELEADLLSLAMGDAI